MRNRRSDRARDEREPHARSSRLQDEPESTLGRKPAELAAEDGSPSDVPRDDGAGADPARES